MIGKTISHYKILSKLGEGGMGVVYKAEDTKLKRTVALKFISPQALREEDDKTRFIHEAQAAAALTHPGICTVYEIDEADGRTFIAMECIEGESLKEKIASGPLRLDETLSIVTQIAEGLEKAHDKGTIHRDIKSANIMVTPDGQVKIMDFGLAKASGATKVTKTGTTVGTVAYMSPEQARGEAVDSRSDVWSLGVVLYEMLTGQLPFKGDYGDAVVYSMLNEVPEPVTALRTGVPMELERIVGKALQKEMSTRYQSAAEVLADLRRLRSEQEVVATPVQRGKRVRARSVVLAGVAAVVVIGGYLLASQFLWRPQKELLSVREKSVAVLPFENMVPGPENEWFSNGITEDIITQLSKIGELSVISRTSVMLYKDSDKSMRQIGEELGVASILEGSVRRSGDRVRIVSQLIDARTDEHIWAETYDREMEDIFDIQSEVAQKIALALKAKLSPEEKERIEEKPTESLTAYDYYLKGREYYYRYRKQDNENAIGLFKRALELDPGYALAYAGLGDAYGQRVWKFGFASAWVDSAIEVSEKAISINPGCAEAYKALGLAYHARGWLRKGLEAYRKAVGLNPNYYPAVGNIGVVNFEIGELNEALWWYKKALVLNPTDARRYARIGYLYSILGDYAEAERWINRALELQPDYVDARVGLIWIYLERGKHDEARMQSHRILSIAPDDDWALEVAGDVELFDGKIEQAKHYYERAMELIPSEVSEMFDVSLPVSLAHIYWKEGREEEARELLGECLKSCQKQLGKGSEGYYDLYLVAVINAIQGRKAEAREWLQKAIDAGWRRHRWASVNPLFENIHNDLQFKKMMAEVKVMVEDMRKRAEGEEATR
jgi:serine/threonine protein kinase/tetratricopeptide (TPR) repeat protein